MDFEQDFDSSFISSMAQSDERSVAPVKIEEDDIVENILRPKTIGEYVGQNKVKENLSVYIQATKKRGEALDHCLLYGPPGLGKTTLASVIANELGVSIKVTTGPTIEKPADLVSMLTNLNENDVLFIDEIHRLNHNVEEILYPAMEDYVIDVMLGSGPSARSMRLNLPKFTLIGATTKAGMLAGPLRDRFGISCRLELYSTDDLMKICKRSAKILGIEIDDQSAREISSRSRGTPRIVNRLLKRVRDYADVLGSGKISIDITKIALNKMDIDELGLDLIDRRLLLTMIDKFHGKPVGLDTLSASTGEEASTIEDVYEPYLLQLGFISRTPKGRVALEPAYRHLGKTYLE